MSLLLTLTCKGESVRPSLPLRSVQAETDAAWRQWFVLPHLRDPTRDAQFHVFFRSGPLSVVFMHDKMLCIIHR